MKLPLLSCMARSTPDLNETDQQTLETCLNHIRPRQCTLGVHQVDDSHDGVYEPVRHHQRNLSSLFINTEPKASTLKWDRKQTIVPKKEAVSGLRRERTQDTCLDFKTHSRSDSRSYRRPTERPNLNCLSSLFEKRNAAFKTFAGEVDAWLQTEEHLQTFRK